MLLCFKVLLLIQECNENVFYINSQEPSSTTVHWAAEDSLWNSQSSLEWGSRHMQAASMHASYAASSSLSISHQMTRYVRLFVFPIMWLKLGFSYWVNRLYNKTWSAFWASTLCRSVGALMQSIRMCNDDWGPNHRSSLRCLVNVPSTLDNVHVNLLNIFL